MFSFYGESQKNSFHSWFVRIRIQIWFTCYISLICLLNILKSLTVPLSSPPYFIWKNFKCFKKSYKKNAMRTPLHSHFTHFPDSVCVFHFAKPFDSLWAHCRPVRFLSWNILVYSPNNDIELWGHIINITQENLTPKQECHF